MEFTPGRKVSKEGDFITQGGTLRNIDKLLCCRLTLGSLPSITKHRPQSLLTHSSDWSIYLTQNSLLEPSRKAFTPCRGAAMVLKGEESADWYCLTLIYSSQLLCTSRCFLPQKSADSGKPHQVLSRYVRIIES